MILAGTAFFVPHAGNSATPPARRADRASLTRAEATPIASVITSETFRVMPEHAYDALIEEAAETHHIDPVLLRAVIQTESAFDATAVSAAGAQGLMQLMPALSAELGVTNPLDPRQNIMAGSRYLRALISYHGGDISLALASYNAGPGAVARYQGIPPYEETARYVKTIVDLLADEDD